MQTITRFGQKTAVDEVFLATGSGDLARMLKALPLKSNGVDRHYLLISVVEALYKRRDDSTCQRQLVEIAYVHLRELPRLLNDLRRHDVESRRARDDERGAANLSRDWVPPAIPTFDRLCMVMCEQGDFEAAREVWRDAVEIGYADKASLPRWFALIEKRAKRLGNPPSDSA